MEATDRAHPEREFSKETRKAERVAANGACRICGKTRELEVLQSAHIYTHSLNSHWERAGSDSKKWHDDNYVSSEANCLLLCKPHHGKIDSQRGLQICTVEYLESLKSDLTHCTALIEKSGQVRRCRKLNGRGNPNAKGDGYHCHLHLKGGLEEELQPRAGWTAQAAPAQKSRGCVIL